MTARLEGRTALITGAAAGIGRAAARMFAREGAALVLVDRDADSLETVRAELADGGARVEAVAADLTREQDIADAVDVHRHAHGGMDVLFNCAGGSSSEDGTIEELTSEVLDRTFRLELYSVSQVSAAAMPLMRAAGGGSIVNMTSYAAFHGTVRIHAYAAAKGAVAALTRAMAGTYAKELVRVNAIAPAAALSDRAKLRLTEGNVADGLTFDWADYPFAMGPPEDIASIALFLASAESRMLTGQVLMADGGISAY